MLHNSPSINIRHGTRVKNFQWGRHIGKEELLKSISQAFGINEPIRGFRDTAHRVLTPEDLVRSPEDIKAHETYSILTKSKWAHHRSTRTPFLSNPSAVSFF